MSEQDRLARAALSRLGEPGDLRMCGLVHDLGAQAVYDALADPVDETDLSRDVAARLVALDPARELEQAQKLGLRFVIPSDPEWPTQLGDLQRVDAIQDRGKVPIGLWVRGPLRLDTLADSVAVVGARSATTYGTHVARDIAADVAATGRAIVSGAAFGIDGAGHRGALAVPGPTVAVLACGADRVYPAAHRDLIDYIAEVGAVVSESPPGAAPMRMRFLARNRIIAALARGTVVVEAAVRSGALNTANWAERLNRAVMGVPGQVTSAPSAGVHEMVRTGGAVLVTCGKDVLEVMGESGQHLVEAPRSAARPRDRLKRREQQVLEGVPVVDPAPVDRIARSAGIGVVEVQGILGRLVDAGFVQQVGIGWRLGPAAIQDRRERIGLRVVSEPRE